MPKTCFRCTLPLHSCVHTHHKHVCTLAVRARVCVWCVYSVNYLVFELRRTRTMKCRSINVCAHKCANLQLNLILNARGQCAYVEIIINDRMGVCTLVCTLVRRLKKNSSNMRTVRLRVPLLRNVAWSFSHHLACLSLMFVYFIEIYNTCTHDVCIYFYRLLVCGLVFFSRHTYSYTHNR